MASFRRSSFWGSTGRWCAVGVVCCTVAPCVAATVDAHAADQRAKDRVWRQAVAARESFEAEPMEEHTRDEFAQVMDNFRAIYHENPADLHAPGAVNAVAELLAEQGRELKDPKSLRAAAGQYAFLAKAYPQSFLAKPATAKAAALLRPEAANDPAKAAELREAPRPAAVRTRGETEESGSSAGTTAKRVIDGADADVSESRVPVVMTERKTEAPDAANAAPAVVTGIRHWSTPTYTRVAIDLGGEVRYQAARTEHPDRIFFDLHGAKLAAGLAGKTFAVTDEGFLKTIRAAQAGADVTRVVLDVDPVAEYSAFLLPNPYRLIIDIHGRPAASARTAPDPDAMAVGDVAAQKPAARRSGVAQVPDGDAGAVGDAAAAAKPAPIVRTVPGVVETNGTRAAASGAGEISSLPPMPVTDGSASFGLPAKRDAPVSGTAVARPRVVVSARPTAMRPVPNTVSSATPGSGREVAEVSDAPDVVTATNKPTSKPVAVKAEGRRQDAGSAEQAAAGRADAAGLDLATPVASRGKVAGRKRQSSTPELAGTPAQPAPPTAEGQSTLMRALGLKIGRIVIDAGHGGHDSGTLGPGGIEEKDVVLDVALRLGKLLHDRLGAEVVYTRADDTFIPLETRTAIANKAQADLFISVHANSSQDPDARGVEVYYLNFTSDPEAMQVASRENAVSSQRVNQLSNLVKKIALKDKIDESRELAADVDTSLYAGLHKGNAGLKDRGVKKAPFVVLIGANMPSVLAEISFVTNPDDAAELETPGYRERVAESLYNGIARYAGAINGATAKKARAVERAAR